MDIVGRKHTTLGSTGWSLQILLLVSLTLVVNALALGTPQAILGAVLYIVSGFVSIFALKDKTSPSPGPRNVLSYADIKSIHIRGH
jgi:hypothetical protein